MKPEIKIVEIKEQPTLTIRESADLASIPEKMGRIFMEIFAFMQKRGIVPVGPPFSYWHDVFSEAASKGIFDMEAGFPVSRPVESEGRIKAGKLPGGKAVKAVHIGPYETLSETYDAVLSWTKEKGYQVEEYMWETYLTDPDTVPDQSKWMTEIFWPIK
jgi:effector-binding domain-containing protein